MLAHPERWSSASEGSNWRGPEQNKKGSGDGRGKARLSRYGVETWRTNDIHDPRYLQLAALFDTREKWMATQLSVRVWAYTKAGVETAASISDSTSGSERRRSNPSGRVRARFRGTRTRQTRRCSSEARDTTHQQKKRLISTPNHCKNIAALRLSVSTALRARPVSVKTSSHPCSIM